MNSIRSKKIILTYLGQREINQAKKDDSNLSKNEDSANAQADALVKAAGETQYNQEEVKPDWYKDSK